ncbi:hypothetical protein L207DRAFT_565845 [Hyaloscypha variabilis F]|uniref:Heterokaryon incompatibility domain-containing protein n=1 Tax=Hyaloscypha variabilis (strain UAMH 11265 / GT02V1 / F) TaxID=1149755 RepID=A0A2J6RPE2_HYAVF|nr:hypothetical protein L207DRAFT_565845 [Hyaloscypha variabilis F]
MTSQGEKGHRRGNSGVRRSRTPELASGTSEQTSEPANKRIRLASEGNREQQMQLEPDVLGLRVVGREQNSPDGPNSSVSNQDGERGGGLLATQPSPAGFNPPDTGSNEAKPFENIPLELITGRIPAIRPILSYRSLEYIPLVKAPGDRDKPDLIRVLIVHPAEHGHQLECSIKIRILPLLDARGKAKTIKVDGIEDCDLPMHEYVALSYAWEGQKPTETIHIRHPEGLLSLLVTYNLKMALLALRHTREDRIFWADAICMDQDDNVEKSQQLPLMSRIYSEAKHVCVWLGDQDTHTMAAFALMGKIRHSTCEEWVAFNDLMKRPWFKRRWVVQEIVLAGRAELWCGSACIEWMHFAQAVAFFEAMRERVKTKFRRDELYDNHPDMFGEVRESSASRLVKVTADIVSRRDDGRVVQKVESLESLISTLTPFETGERKDIIYAILSLAKDVRAIAADAVLKSTLEMSDLPEELNSRPDSEKVLRALNQIMRNMKVDRFPVNYDKSFSEVCDDLYKFTTLHSKSLDLICRPWCPREPNDKLPSWVRPFKDNAFKLDKEGHTVRVNADTLVSLPGRSPYQASGKLQGKWSFERDGGVMGPQILSVEGFKLDIVSKVEDVARGGTLPETWLPYKTPEPSESGTTSWQEPEKSVSEQFWRTMVAGKGLNGHNPSLSYSLVCQELFDSEDAINLEKQRNLTTNAVLIEFIDRVLSVIWGRTLTRTTKHNRLALLPKAAESGDVICILYGCSVPVVLRKTTDRTTEGEIIWELIGECYMNEMMAGEALVKRREGSEVDSELREFYRIGEFKIG